MLKVFRGSFLVTGSRLKHSQSSHKWLQRHNNDRYVKQARVDGLPSRAYYKLEQMDLLCKRGRGNRKAIFSNGQTIVELGAAPGGWSLYAATRIGPQGMLVAIDLLPLDKDVLLRLQGQDHEESKNPTFSFYQGDFTSNQAQDWIVKTLSEKNKNPETTGVNFSPCVDVIMSDMAPNFTGDSRTDAIRTVALCEEALVFAVGTKSFLGIRCDTTDEKSWKSVGMLKNGGSFLCKYFSCGPQDEKDLLAALKKNFERVDFLKPDSSRKASAERFVLGTNYTRKD